MVDFKPTGKKWKEYTKEERDSIASEVSATAEILQRLDKIQELLEAL